MKNPQRIEINIDSINYSIYLYEQEISIYYQNNNDPYLKWIALKPIHNNYIDWYSSFKENLTQHRFTEKHYLTDKVIIICDKLLKNKAFL